MASTLDGRGGKTRPDKFLYYVVAVGRNDGLFGLAERLCSNTTILLEKTTINMYITRNCKGDY